MQSLGYTEYFSVILNYFSALYFWGMVREIVSVCYDEKLWCVRIKS